MVAVLKRHGLAGAGAVLAGALWCRKNRRHACMGNASGCSRRIPGRRLMRLAAPALLCSALAGAVLGGCGNAGRGDARAENVTTPQIVGVSQSSAECLLEARGLRWRYGGDGAIRREPIVPCRDGAVITPDPRVVRQEPVAGAKIIRGGVVGFETECTLRRRADEVPCA